MPHYSTWSRVLGHGVEPNEVEQMVGRFFAQAVRTAHRKRGTIHLAIDGKTLRGTIPLGETEGVHPAFGLPAETSRGAGSDECRAQGEGNHVCSHPVASARFARRGGKFRCHVLSPFGSLKIVRAQGDYLWTVKNNEKSFYQVIELIFQPHRNRADACAPP